MASVIDSEWSCTSNQISTVGEGLLVGYGTTDEIAQHMTDLHNSNLTRRTINSAMLSGYNEAEDIARRIHQAKSE